jgi:hypothetical protein
MELMDNRILAGLTTIEKTEGRAYRGAKKNDKNSPRDLIGSVPHHSSNGRNGFPHAIYF